MAFNGWSSQSHSYRNVDKKSYPYPAMLGKVMYAIKDDPTLLYLVLKDEELARWWSMRQSKENARVSKELEKQRLIDEKERLEKVKADLMNTLTDDQKKALGLLPI